MVFEEVKLDVRPWAGAFGPPLEVAGGAVRTPLEVGVVLGAAEAGIFHYKKKIGGNLGHPFGNSRLRRRHLSGYKIGN